MVSHLLQEQTVCSIPAAPCQPEPAPLGLLTPHTTLTVNEMQYSINMPGLKTIYGNLLR